MKKFLFVLLASAAVTPAMAQGWGYATGGSNNTVYQQQRTTTTTTTYQQPVVTTTNRQIQPSAQGAYAVRTEQVPVASGYKLGNPLSRPRANKVVFGVEGDYAYVPKDNSIPQPKATGWNVLPNVEVGLTDKLSVKASASYGELKIKSIDKKTKMYSADVRLSYLLASADGFDFNVHAGAYYDKARSDKTYLENKNERTSGVDVGLLVGKKIQNITPYFGVGFRSDLWSRKNNSTGTQTYINPGVYIDLIKNLSLDLNYESKTHGTATYKARFDIYPSDNVVFSIGGTLVHPETKTNVYGATAGFKVLF